MTTKDNAAEKAARSEAASLMGKKGGPKGGINRWVGISPAERSKIARNAIKARWAKEKARAKAKENR